MDNLPVKLMWRHRLGAGLLMLAAVMFTPAIAGAQGCAMCGTVGNGANDPLVKGMFASIVLMAFMPATLTLVVGGWFVHWHRTGRFDAPGGIDEGPDSRNDAGAAEDDESRRD